MIVFMTKNHYTLHSDNCLSLLQAVHFPHTRVELRLLSEADCGIWTQGFPFILYEKHLASKYTKETWNVARSCRQKFHKIIVFIYHMKF
jgi:hypothetical protein